MYSLCFFGAAAFLLPSRASWNHSEWSHTICVFQNKIALMAIMATETDTKIHTKHKMLMQS
jgi:hypothetical protein